MSVALPPITPRTEPQASPRPARPTVAPLDVAIAGTRGVPASYGGFETFAEELGRRLVARGHRVTVYGRTAYVGAQRRTHLGMQVVPVAAPRGKHLETPLHTLLVGLRAARAGHDVVLLCNAANAFAVPLFRAGGARVAINVDGLDRLRRKWGVAGRLWYEVGERLALWLADLALADAGTIRDAYRARHGVELPVIPYGGDRATDVASGDRATDVASGDGSTHVASGDRSPPSASWLDAFGVAPGRYVLVVGRLEPENNAHLVVEAWRRSARDLPLVVVGDAPYADAYKRRIRDAAGGDDRIRCVGGVYGEAYLALQAHAAVYVAAGEVGGTHPALVEAMALGAPVVANDVPEHREVLGDAGLFYRPGDPADLRARLEELLADPVRAERLRARARARVADRYRWDDVTDAYERVLAALVRR